MRKQSIVVRATMICALVMGMAVAAMAAHPFVGTWKLNVTKSKAAASGLAAAKDLTVVCQEIGTDIETAFTGTGADGKPISAKFTIPQQGGVLGSAQAPGEASFIVITVIEPSDMYGTSIQKGKQAEVTHTFVSKDGKTMTRTSKGMDAEGKPYETLMVFDKQ